MFSKLSSSIEESFVSSLLVAMTLLVFSEVVARFVFNTGYQWMEEVTLTLGSWFVLFGASYGVKVGAHIGVDAFVQSLPKETRKITSIITIVLCLCYCSLFLYGSWGYLAKMYSIGITMEDVHVPQVFVNLFEDETLWNVFRIDSEEALMPLWISQSILLLGFGLLFYRFFQLLLQVISGKTNGFKFADEAEESMHLAQEIEQENEQKNTQINTSIDDKSTQQIEEKH